VHIRHKPGQNSAEVERAIDGDTLLCWVRIDDDVKVRRRCRLLGIDSYELDGADAAQAKAVAELLTAALHGHEIQIEYSAERRDRYGRALIKASFEGQDLGEWIIAHGWAWHFGDPDRMKHAAKNLRNATKAAAKLALSIFLAPLLMTACHSPSVVYHPVPPTPHHASTQSGIQQGEQPTATTQPPVMCIIERGGQLTITGNDSPVSASETNSTAAIAHIWRNYFAAAALGAVLMLLVVIGCRIGWRVIITAAKASL
jgi:endonuclease YncB( thermonuclease family)